jgi:hypothetical protein
MGFLAIMTRIWAKKTEKQGFFAGLAFFALKRVILTRVWRNYTAACRAVHALRGVPGVTSPLDAIL